MENVDHHFGAAIPEHDVASDEDAFAIRRRRSHAAVQVSGDNHHSTLQFTRKCRADHQPVFQIDGQAVPSGKSRREMPVVVGIPAANFIAVMIGETVAPTVVVIVMVSVLVPPVAVVMIAIAIAITITMIAIFMVAIPVILISLTSQYRAA